MESLWENRIAEWRKKFSTFSSAAEKYTFLLELGQALPPLGAELRTPEAVVAGCQSVLYLHAERRGGLLFFSAHSESLISRGLAALLIGLYQGLSPREILLNPPVVLEELGVFASLSPGRSNGLAHMYVRMKQEALRALV